MRGSKGFRILGIVLAVVALIGLLRVLFGMTNGVNLGVFLAPGALSVVLLYRSRPIKE